jgi:undecaprenyl phosphate-alpha-L-ara4N flippase subunit ArnF
MKVGGDRMTTVLILLGAIAFATAGQLFLKAGMTEVGVVVGVGLDGALPLAGRIATTWQVVVGLALFATSAAFWLITLSRVPLSTAYPVVSLSYVLILVFSVVVLDERPPLSVWVGAGLIVSGISLIGLGQR